MIKQYYTVAWFLGTLAVVIAILVAIGIIVAHRIKAHLKRQELKDEYTAKALAVTLHHRHSNFVEEIEAADELRKRPALTEGSNQGRWKDEMVTPKIRRSKVVAK